MSLTPGQKKERAHHCLPIPEVDDVKDFVQAAGEGNIHALEIYIDVFGQDCVDEYEKMTALMNATLHGHMKCIDFLLQQGADINARNEEGWTAAFYALFTDDAVLLDNLLDKGASMEQQDNNGMTLLLFAAWQGAVNCVSLLLERGANMTVIDNEGMDMKERALCGSHYDIVELIENHKQALAERARREKVAAIRDIFGKGTSEQMKYTRLKPSVYKKPPLID